MSDPLRSRPIPGARGPAKDSFRSAIILAGLGLLVLLTLVVCYKAFIAGPPSGKSGGLSDTVTQQMDRSAPRIPLRPQSGSGNRMLLLPAEGQKEGTAPETASADELPTDAGVAAKPGDGTGPAGETRADKKRPQRRAGGPIQFPTVGGDRPTGSNSGGYPAAPGQRAAGENRVPLVPFEGGREERPSVDLYEEGRRQLRPRRSLSGMGEGDDTPGPASTIKKYSKDGIGERQTGDSRVMPGWVTLDNGRKIFVTEVGGIKTDSSPSEGKGGSTQGSAPAAGQIQKALGGGSPGN